MVKSTRSRPTDPREEIERGKAGDEFGRFPPHLRGFDLFADFDVFFALVGFVGFLESIHLAFAFFCRRRFRFGWFGRTGTDFYGDRNVRGGREN